jgi:hypothetical protein
VPLTTDDLNAIQARIEAVVPTLVRFKVLATGHDPANLNANTDTVWTFGGRNIVDILVQTLLNQEAFIATINSLRDLIIADDANDVTAQQVADALQGIIVAQVVPAVVNAVEAEVADLEVTVDAHAIAVAAAEEIHSRLAG